ncbi:hypothetical protein [Streptococcus pneumoniae]|uniref:hypothetical protein n=1 Tax=Streptococcus pneumoniae TaxID=1313 RepID=UPI000A9B1AE6|nr:hypothetical protein [Streptococcus pneumoniae]
MGLFFYNKIGSIISIGGLPTTNIIESKIKEQTRKLAAGCSKHCFEVVDETDEVSNHTYGKAKLMRFEEIFEEY